MAAAEPGNIRTHLSYMMECVICTEPYNDPRSLPCVHTYCLECLRSLCRGKKPREEVPCPLCCNKFKIPENGVDDLPKNFMVEQLKEAAEFEQLQNVEFTSGLSCELCSDESGSRVRKSATMFCVECDQRMCDACANAHKRSRVSSSHMIEKLEGLELAPEATGQYCDSHKNRVLKLYWFDCKEALCATCYAEMHNTHKCSDVNEAADEFRTQVKSDTYSLNIMVSNCRGFIQKQSRNKSELSGRIQDFERDICDRLEQLKQQIQLEKQTLLAEVDLYKNGKMKQINHVVHEIEQHVFATENLVEYAGELVERGTAGDITQLLSDVHDKAFELLNLDKIQDVMSHLDSFKITFTPSVEVLTQSSEKIVGQVQEITSEYMTVLLT